MRPCTLKDLRRINSYGPSTAAVNPMVRLIQCLCWQYGEDGALERLNAQQTARAA